MEDDPDDTLCIFLQVSTTFSFSYFEDLNRRTIFGWSKSNGRIFMRLKSLPAYYYLLGHKPHPLTHTTILSTSSAGAFSCASFVVFPSSPYWTKVLHLRLAASASQVGGDILDIFGRCSRFAPLDMRELVFWTERRTVVCTNVQSHPEVFGHDKNCGIG